MTFLRKYLICTMLNNSLSIKNHNKVIKTNGLTDSLLLYNLQLKK
jgi:hypothetical protein